MIQLETVRDVHKHTDIVVEDCAGVHAAIVGVGRCVRAPEHPLTGPEAGRCNAFLIQAVGSLLIEAAALGVCPKILSRCHNRLIGRRLEGHAVVLQIHAQHSGASNGGEVEHTAAAVFHLRPVHFTVLAVISVFFGPLLSLCDRVDLLALAVHQRNVGVDEAVPVAVELLDSTHHSLVNFRDMAPAGCCQSIEDGIVVLIDQRHGVQAGVLPVCCFLPDNVVRLYR